MKFLNEYKGFKVGDRVIGIGSTMRKGETGTIYKINTYHVDVIWDGLTSGHDGYANDGSHNHWKIAFENLQHFESATPTKYKVGDLVNVRSYLSTEKYYGGIYPSEQMLHKVGQKVRIKAVTKTGRYKIEGSCFTWTDEMFEEVKKETKVETKTEKREPKVGDRIRMTTDFCNAKTGMTGVIKVKRNSDFGVEFDEDFRGHSCGGQTKPHRGHWVNACHFELIDTQKYFIVTVTFDNDKEYCYLSDISVKKGDKVVVPCGTCDRETIATVVKTGKYTEENAPYPVDKMKKVIRRGTDTKPTSENDFDWDKFKDNKIIVHCRTQKSWDNFLEECEKRDIKWNSYDRATYGSCYWLNNKDQSSIVKGMFGAYGMSHTSLEWHRKEMPTAAVYDWTSKKYVDKPVEEKKVDEKPTYKVDDRVKIKGGYCDGKTGVIYKILENCIWDVDIIVDNFTDGHDGDAHDVSKNHWYVDFDSIEKIEKVETKPTPKIEVGDVVRAIDNHYGMTNIHRNWEGVVIKVDGASFDAVTTNSSTDRYSEGYYWSLRPEHFEIIKKNT